MVRELGDQRMSKDLYTPKKKVMPEVPGMRLVQHNYYDIGLLDGSFVDKLYISVVEQIDDAIVAECVKIAHEAGIGQHILLNKKFIVDAIQEKLEAQQVINGARPVDAEVVRHEGNTTFVTTDNLDAYADRIIVRQGNWCKVYYRDSDDAEDGR